MVILDAGSWRGAVPGVVPGVVVTVIVVPVALVVVVTCRGCRGAIARQRVEALGRAVAKPNPRPTLGAVRGGPHLQVERDALADRDGRVLDGPLARGERVEWRTRRSGCGRRT